MMMEYSCSAIERPAPDAIRLRKSSRCIVSDTGIRASSERRSGRVTGSSQALLKWNRAFSKSKNGEIYLCLFVVKVLAGCRTLEAMREHVADPEPADLGALDPLLS